MITEFLLSMFLAVFEWVVSVFPAPDISGLVTPAVQYLSWFDSNTDWIDAVLPLPLLGLVLASWLGSILIAWSIRIVRIVVSYLTLGGGMGA